MKYKPGQKVWVGPFWSDCGFTKYYELGTYRYQSKQWFIVEIRREHGRQFIYALKGGFGIGTDPLHKRVGDLKLCTRRQANPIRERFTNVWKKVQCKDCRRMK